MITSTDVDRLFLQAVLSRGIMTRTLAQRLHKACIDAVNSTNQALKLKYSDNNETWTNFVNNINRSIDKLDLEFRHVSDEVSGTDLYALVNRKGDEVAQMATDYTPVEIAFFKAVVEQIMLAPHEAYSVSSMAALRELSALKINMTKSQAEVVLASFVANAWLLKSEKGRYSLGPRSMLELLPYLKSTYPEDLHACKVCDATVTRGFACPTPNCPIRMHTHCLAKHRRSRKQHCPECSCEWPTDKTLLPVGEEAAKAADDFGRRTRRDEEASEEEDEDEAEEQDEAEAQDTPPRRRKGKKSAREDSMDVDEDEEEQVDVKPEPSQTQRTQRLRRSNRQ